MGDLWAAFRAGATLKIIPTITDTPTAISIIGGVITGFKLV